MPRAHRLLRQTNREIDRRSSASAPGAERASHRPCRAFRRSGRREDDGGHTLFREPTLFLHYGFQTRIGLRPDGRPARSHRTACRGHHPRVEAQHAGRRDRLGQDFHGGQRHRGAEASDAGAEPQQDPRGAALRRIPQLLSGECRGVLRILLRLLPAGGLPPGDGHLYRKGPVDQCRNREDAAQHRSHAPLGAARRGGRVERVVSVRLRISTPWPSP